MGIPYDVQSGFQEDARSESEGVCRGPIELVSPDCCLVTRNAGLNDLEDEFRDLETPVHCLHELRLRMGSTYRASKRNIIVKMHNIPLSVGKSFAK